MADSNGGNGGGASDWLPWVNTAVSVASAIGKGQQQGRNNATADQAVQWAREKYAAAAPWRQYALNGLAAANAPVNSRSLFENKQNPFAKSYDYGQDLGAHRIADVNPNTYSDTAPTGIGAAATGAQNAGLGRSYPGYQGPDVGSTIPHPPASGLQPTGSSNGAPDVQGFTTKAEYDAWVARNRSAVPRPVPQGPASPDMDSNAALQAQFLRRYGQNGVSA